MPKQQTKSRKGATAAKDTLLSTLHKTTLTTSSQSIGPSQLRPRYPTPYTRATATSQEKLGTSTRLLSRQTYFEILRREQVMPPRAYTVESTPLREHTPKQLSSWIRPHKRDLLSYRETYHKLRLHWGAYGKGKGPSPPWTQKGHSSLRTILFSGAKTRAAALRAGSRFSWSMMRLSSLKTL